jgi:hypothetical protein
MLINHVSLVKNTAIGGEIVKVIASDYDSDKATEIGVEFYRENCKWLENSSEFSIIQQPSSLIDPKKYMEWFNA